MTTMQEYFQFIVPLASLIISTTSLVIARQVQRRQYLNETYVFQIRDSTIAASRLLSEVKSLITWSTLRAQVKEALPKIHEISSHIYTARKTSENALKDPLLKPKNPIRSRIKYVKNSLSIENDLNELTFSLQKVMNRAEIIINEEELVFARLKVGEMIEKLYIL